MPCVLARLCVKYGIRVSDSRDKLKKLMVDASNAYGKEEKGFRILKVFLLVCCNKYNVSELGLMYSTIERKLKHFSLKHNSSFIWDLSLGNAPVDRVCPLLTSWLVM